MNDREKIIIAIEKAKKQSEECALDRIVVPFKEADMILALLKESEPVKVIIHDEDEWYGFYAECPECACKWMMDFEKLKYCPHCGKAVKYDG